MFKKGFFAVAIVLIAVLALLAGCQRSAKKELTIGVSYASLDIQFFQFYQKGVNEEAKKLGVKVAEVDSFYDVEKQLSGIETLLSQKVDALIVHPVDESAVVPGVLAANKAKVPVFALDRPPTGGKLGCYLSAGHDVIGPMQGEFIAKALDGKGNVVLVQGPLGESYTRKLDAGIKKAFANYPDIKILAEQSAGGWDRAKAMAVMEDFLQKYGDKIDGVICTADMLAMGAMQAIKARNLKKQIKVIGADADLDMLQGIKKGEVAGTIDPQPLESGRIALRTSVLLAQKKPIPDVKDVNGVPTLEVPILLVTKENVDQTPEWGTIPLE